MALSMRRAEIAEIEAVRASDSAAYITGTGDQAPGDRTVIFPFFDDWLAAHYALSGREWDERLPGGFILGGSDWHQASPDMEPAKLLSPETVAEIAAYLAGVGAEEIAARLDALAHARTGLPTGILPRDIPFVIEGIDELVAFVAQAAKAGQAIVKDIG